MAVMRTFLIVAHLVFFALAMALVLKADWQIFRKRLPSRRRMAIVGRQTGWWFLGLLVTGTALVWIDTGFNLERIMDSPKLLAKLTVVAVLTLNGCLLHLWGLRALTQPSASAGRVALALALVGAISSTGWLMATLLGVGRPLASMLGYGGFMAVYAALFMAAAAVAVLRIWPVLVQRLRAPPTAFDTAPAKLQSIAREPMESAEPLRRAA